MITAIVTTRTIPKWRLEILTPWLGKGVEVESLTPEVEEVDKVMLGYGFRVSPYRPRTRVLVAGVGAVWIELLEVARMVAIVLCQVFDNGIGER